MALTTRTRALSQSSYYFWAYLQLRPDVSGPVDFIVPTGALGNAVSGFLAKQMGLPIGTILCATNANDVVHRTITSGDMSIGRNTPTISPAMDIQFAYNLERLLYWCSGGDAATTSRWMRSAQERRAERLPADLLQKVRATFASCCVSDHETLVEMARMHAATGGGTIGYRLCPHSAVGVHALRQPEVAAELLARAGGVDRPPAICVLTAHPAKFEGACTRAGLPREQLAQLEALRGKSQRFQRLHAPTEAAQANGTEGSATDCGARRCKLEAWAGQIRAAVESAAMARTQTAAAGGKAGHSTSAQRSRL